MKEVKVLGPCCSKCIKFAEKVQKVIANSDDEFDFKYTSEMSEFLKYGVIIIPALVIDNKVVLVGKASKKQLEKILL